MFLIKELQVDGDLLLNITEQDLASDLGMTAGLTRKRLVVMKTAPLESKV
jgi:hypothetical protein